MQYTSLEYVQELKSHGFEISIVLTGNPSENVRMGSFLKTLKYEEVHLYEYEMFDDLITGQPYFIEEFYNRKRPRSALGHR